MTSPLTSERVIETVVREEWGRILASLTKTLRDLQLAEDCLQEAVVSAMEHWGRSGLPKSPAAWLITTARRRAIDRLRRQAKFKAKQSEISYLMDLDNCTSAERVVETIPDKRLEMMFTCCHPALDQKTRVALTLRTLGGLSTEEIAAAYLDKTPAMAQRLTRAKKKIAVAGIPYAVPDFEALPERLSGVLNVIYLIFNEGYSLGGVVEGLRSDLSDEAIRLGRIVFQLLPDETECAGLLALMLLSDARRSARFDAEGSLVPLERQDRSLWDGIKIREGVALLEAALSKQKLGPYQLQAAISGVHAQSASWTDTDWPQIVALYDLLYALHPQAIVRLNQAVAVSYASFLTDALAMMSEANGGGALENYQSYHAARADVLARMCKANESREAYDKAIGLCDSEAERRFLEAKSAKLGGEPN